MTSINWDPSHDWDRYCNDQEQAAFGEMVDKLQAALKKVGIEGRNPKCWPFFSFDGKDADLEPKGCSGIKEIIKADEEGFVMVFGAHKTICPDELWDNLQLEMAYNFLPTEFNCEWSGDDWVAWVEHSVDVAWSYHEDDSDIDDVDYEATAYAVIDIVEQALHVFRESMAKTDGIFDTLI